jgi:alpha-L-fucosidase
MLNSTQRRQAWHKMNAEKASAIEDFIDLKFGMFIHWGLYSKPGGVWKGRRIEETGKIAVAEWLMHSFEIPREEYAAQAITFNPIDFDASTWVKLAKAAGMKYVVFTAKHCDGFALYDSAVNSFNLKQATPFARDAVAELHAACLKEGLRFGIYYSHSIDWFHGGDGGYDQHLNHENRVIGWAHNDFDPASQTYDEYIENKALPQMREILARYPGLSHIWYDAPFYMPDAQSYRFYEAVHQADPRILVNERVGNGYGDFLVPGDNIIPDPNSGAIGVFETVGTMNNSWGFKSYDEDWKSPREVLFWLISIVAQGGNYTLNVGPDGFGRIPDANQSILHTIGAWLIANQDAVYDTRPWNVPHEGPAKLAIEGTEQREHDGWKDTITAADLWFTAKGKNVYVIGMRVPDNGKVTIQSLKHTYIRSVCLLENKTLLAFSQGASGRINSWNRGLEVVLPAGFKNELGYVLEVVTE